MGGSVTLFSMLFIWLHRLLVRDLRTGLMTGIAYGLLQLISRSLYHKPSPDDHRLYPGLRSTGTFRSLLQSKKHGLIKGYIAGVLGRSSSLLSFPVFIFFAAYAEGSGMSAPVYSLAYNGSYLGCEAAMTLVEFLQFQP